MCKDIQTFLFHLFEQFEIRNIRIRAEQSKSILAAYSRRGVEISDPDLRPPTEHWENVLVRFEFNENYIIYINIMRVITRKTRGVR